jgi:hypothetical protein
MKAQADSNRRGWKDIICREFSWKKEKNCILRNAGGPKTGWRVGFYSLFALPDGGDAFQMQTGVS